MEHKNRKIMCPDCGIVTQRTAYDNPVVMKLCTDCQVKHFQSGNKCAVCGEPATKYVQAFYDNGTVAQQYFCVTHNFLSIQEQFRGLDALIRTGYVDAEITAEADVAQSYRDKMLGISPEEYKEMTHSDFQAVDKERKRILKLKPDVSKKKGGFISTYGSIGIEPHFPQQLTFDEAKEMTDEVWDKLSEIKARESSDDDKVYVVPDTEHKGLDWSHWYAQVIKDHISDESEEE